MSTELELLRVYEELHRAKKRIAELEELLTITTQNLWNLWSETHKRLEKGKI